MEKKVYIKILIFLVAINTCVNKCIVEFHILEKDNNFFACKKTIDVKSSSTTFCPFERLNLGVVPLEDSLAAKFKKF